MSRPFDWDTRSPCADHAQRRLFLWLSRPSWMAYLDGPAPPKSPPAEPQPPEWARPPLLPSATEWDLPRSHHTHGGRQRAAGQQMADGQARGRRRGGGQERARARSVLSPRTSARQAQAVAVAADVSLTTDVASLWGVHLQSPDRPAWQEWPVVVILETRRWCGGRHRPGLLALMIPARQALHAAPAVNGSGSHLHDQRRARLGPHQ